MVFYIDSLFILSTFFMITGTIFFVCLCVPKKKNSFCPVRPVTDSMRQALESEMMSDSTHTAMDNVEKKKKGRDGKGNSRKKKKKKDPLDVSEKGSRKSKKSKKGRKIANFKMQKDANGETENTNNDLKPAAKARSNAVLTAKKIDREGPSTQMLSAIAKTQESVAITSVQQQQGFFVQKPAGTTPIPRAVPSTEENNPMRSAQIIHPGQPSTTRSVPAF